MRGHYPTTYAFGAMPFGCCDLRGLRVGANVHLLKTMEPDEVVNAIARAQRGKTVVAPAMTRH